MKTTIKDRTVSGNVLEFVPDWDEKGSYLAVREGATWRANSVILERRDVRRLHSALGRWLKKPAKKGKR